MSKEWKKTLGDITKDITREQLSDFISTMLYGSIDYWSETKYNKDVYKATKERIKTDDYDPCFEDILAQMMLDGWNILITDTEENKQYSLELKNLKKGIQMWVLNFRAQSSCDEDWWGVDAEGADVIVQFALFEDIIYG